MTSLYEIDTALLTVIEKGFVFDEDTGEVYFDEGDIEALTKSHEEKLEACAIYFKELNYDAAAIKAEIESLTKRKKALEAKAERIKAYISRSMEMFGDTKLETSRAALSFRRSESVNVYDADALPYRFLDMKQTWTPNKAEIKKAIKNGETVEGATLETSQNLQVK